MRRCTFWVTILSFNRAYSVYISKCGWGPISVLFVGPLDDLQQVVSCALCIQGVAGCSATSVPLPGECYFPTSRGGFSPWGARPVAKGWVVSVPLHSQMTGEF